jgi:hypothetical protein
LVLAVGQHPAAGQTAQPSPVAPTSPSTPAIESRLEAGRPFTREEKMDLAARVLAPPQTAQKTIPQRRKVLSVTAANDIDILPQTRGGRRVARVVVVDYAGGQATRLLVDAATAEVLTQQPIRGRPQASEEEKQDAIKIIRQEPELARLLDGKAIIEGGFLVDGPRNSPARHRFLQVQLLTADRTHLQRTVLVDLTAGTIATAKAGD